MVAGFMAGWMEKHDYTDMHSTWELHAGSASAFSENLATQRRDCQGVYQTGHGKG